MAHDIVIRNGTVIDGTGAPGRRADVAIDGDRITAIGEVEGRAERSFDASTRTSTPSLPGTRSAARLAGTALPRS